jgi:hypothetical protein
MGVTWQGPKSNPPAGRIPLADTNLNTPTKIMIIQPPKFATAGFKKFWPGKKTRNPLEINYLKPKLRAANPLAHPSLSLRPIASLQPPIHRHRQQKLGPAEPAIDPA